MSDAGVSKAMTLDQLLSVFNNYFIERHNVVLVGGFAEPLYKPGTATESAQIQFTRDYIRSALHEIAHWCIAGPERRQMVDYGYWYRPDGRNAEEQKEFFTAEVKPQALELAFSRHCQVSFQVSTDNLTGAVIDNDLFARAVEQQLATYESVGFPPRAQEFLDLFVV